MVIGGTPSSGVGAHADATALARRTVEPIVPTSRSERQRHSATPAAAKLRAECFELPERDAVVGFAGKSSLEGVARRLFVTELK